MLADAHIAVSGYGYKRGSKAYELNEKWNTDNNGVVGKGEAVQNKAFQAHCNQRINSEEKIAENQTKIQQAQIFKPGTCRPAPIQVLKISPVLAKIGQRITCYAATNINIGQTVSDRSIAHVQSVGLGYDQYSV